MSCKESDHSLCEFSKIAESSKFYYDKLKLTLMAKHHLNLMINTSNANSPYPLMMIMGFEFVFMTLEFVEDVGYILKEIDRCCFPITKTAVEEGGIEELIKCINSVKHHVSSIKNRNEAEKKKKTINKLTHLVDGKGEKKIQYNTTPVIWPKKKDAFVEIAFGDLEDVPELVFRKNQEEEEDEDRSEDDGSQGSEDGENGNIDDDEN